MNIHYLQHVPFEGLGYIETWATNLGHAITCTRLFENEQPPQLDTIDALIIMGGPMGIYDHAEHPWLIEEKEFIRRAINAQIPTLGICLGAQLIADVLGAKVYPGPQQEIGWFPILKSAKAPDWFPSEFTGFHWHNDTFELPEKAIHLASSEACKNQGFIYRNHVIALQFHLETTEQSLSALIENCGNDLVEAPFTQTTEQMNAGIKNIPAINTLIQTLLNRLFAAPPTK